MRVLSGVGLWPTGVIFMGGILALFGGIRGWVLGVLIGVFTGESRGFNWGFGFACKHDSYKGGDTWAGYKRVVVVVYECVR